MCRLKLAAGCQQNLRDRLAAAAWAAQFGIGGYSSDIAALRSYAANLSLMPEQAQ